MAPSFLSEAATEALSGAIKAIESRSSAEVVITVRAESARYGHVGFVCGLVAAFGALAFLLYSPYDFSYWSLLLDPLVVGLLVGFGCWRVGTLRRWLTPGALGRAEVLRAAQATFFHKGIRNTCGRTGVLVYISVLERRAEVLADSGVVAAVMDADWDRAVAAIQGAVERGEDGVAAARLITALGELLEPALPRAEDDVNELPDEVS